MTGLQHPQPSTPECMKDQGTMDTWPLQSSVVLRDGPPGRHVTGHVLVPMDSLTRLNTHARGIFSGKKPNWCDQESAVPGLWSLNTGSFCFSSHPSTLTLTCSPLSPLLPFWPGSPISPWGGTGRMLSVAVCAFPQSHGQSFLETNNSCSPDGPKICKQDLHVLM